MTRIDRIEVTMTFYREFEGGAQTVHFVYEPKIFDDPFALAVAAKNDELLLAAYKPDAIG